MNQLESYSGLSPFEKDEEFAKITIDDIGSPFILDGLTNANKEYTLSFWMRSETSSTITIGKESHSVSSTWIKYSFTFIADDKYISIFFNKTGVYYIYHMQLELGNKPSDWTPAPEDIEEKVDNVETDLIQRIFEQRTSIVSDTEQIILSALKSYVTTGDYESYKETVLAQLAVMSDEIKMTFETTSSQIDDVNGNIQSQFNEFYKHISFTGDNGIEIHDGNNSLTLTMDTDGISFKKNGEQFGFWDGNDFYTGNIIVEVNERAQLGNYAFVPRSDGSLMFLKVGG